MSQILFSPREDKIHIFKPSCIFFYIGLVIIQKQMRNYTTVVEDIVNTMQWRKMIT